jgi:hypothetical protein
MRFGSVTLRCVRGENRWATAGFAVDMMQG